MINMKHKIKVNNGKVDFLNLPLFNKDLKQYEGKEAFLVIKPYKDSRSDNQNRYYWGVVIKLLCDEIGYLPEEMHEILKQKFLSTRTVKIGNEEYSISDSSSTLNTTEFEDYLSKVRTWASQDLELLIPLPNDIEY